MALSPALLQSTASAFHGHFTVRLPSVSFAAVRSGGLSVKASSVVLVENTEAEKVERLKSAYLEKIVPVLKEEFNYTNIHQVRCDITGVFVEILEFVWIFVCVMSLIRTHYVAGYFCVNATVIYQ